MASNQLPRSQDQLLTLAEDFADGLHAHEVAVGMKHHVEAVVRPEITALRQAEAAFQAARAEKQVRTAAQTAADLNARAFVSKVRKALAFHLGDQWSAAWLPTGFPNNSTAVPENPTLRQELLAQLKLYFTANPTHELAAQGVTAAQAGTLFNALSDARAAVADQVRDAGAKKAARNAAETALRTRLSRGIAELGQLLGDDDPRWHAFGLNLPSDPDTPEVVTGLVVTPAGAGTLFVDWADARRASFYRVWIQVVGVDAEFRQAERRDESDATLTGLPTGKTVSVKVTAANDAGDGPASEPVQAVVG